MTTAMRTVLAGLLTLLAPKRTQAAPPTTAQRVGTLDGDAILDAISAVETGHEYWRVGRKGERGRCQFMLSTWVRYTPAHFTEWASRDCQLTRRVERSHLAYLLRTLFQPGQVPEPALVAAAWRYGPRQAVAHVRGDYAKRVANLYWDAIGRKGAAR